LQVSEDRLKVNDVISAEKEQLQTRLAMLETKKTFLEGQLEMSKCEEQMAKQTIHTMQENFLKERAEILNALQLRFKESENSWHEIVKSMDILHERLRELDAEMTIFTGAMTTKLDSWDVEKAQYKAKEEQQNTRIADLQRKLDVLNDALDQGKKETGKLTETYVMKLEELTAERAALRQNIEEARTAFEEMQKSMETNGSKVVKALLNEHSNHSQ